MSNELLEYLAARFQYFKASKKHPLSEYAKVWEFHEFVTAYQQGYIDIEDK